jgi:SAM-dependent methyltransferase
MTDVPNIFDRKAVLQRKARAERIPDDKILATEAGKGLAHRLRTVSRIFEKPMALDVPAAAFVRFEGIAREWTLATIGEGEEVPLEHEHFDLVVSVLSLHAVNDLPGVMLQIRHALKPDGLFMAALFGGDTLRELRESFAAGESEVLGGISPRVAPFADVRDMGGLLQRAGFALPVADVERTTIHYRAFSTLVRDLRAAGETNALAQRQRAPIRRDVLGAALSHYTRNHADTDGRLRATFDIIYLTGWSSHESQQQPLKPGAAKMRLADALGTVERTAGDSADPKR